MHEKLIIDIIHKERTASTTTRPSGCSCSKEATISENNNTYEK